MMKKYNSPASDHSSKPLFGFEKKEPQTDCSNSKQALDGRSPALRGATLLWRRGTARARFGGRDLPGGLRWCLAGGEKIPFSKPDVGQSEGLPEALKSARGGRQNSLSAHLSDEQSADLCLIRQP